MVGVSRSGLELDRRLVHGSYLGFEFGRALGQQVRRFEDLVATCHGELPFDDDFRAVLEEVRRLEALVDDGERLADRSTAVRRGVLDREDNSLAFEVSFDRSVGDVAMHARGAPDHLVRTRMECVEVLEILEGQASVHLARAPPAEQERDGGSTDGNLNTLGHGVRVLSEDCLLEDGMAIVECCGVVAIHGDAIEVGLGSARERD